MKIHPGLVALFALLSVLLLSGCDTRPSDLEPPASRTVAVAPDAPPISRMGGEWVVITGGQGRSGEAVASSWYLFRFRADNTARVIWVTPGHYAREVVTYTQQGDTVTLTGALEAPQVNNVPFRLSGDVLTGSLAGPGGGDNLAFSHRGIGWPYLHWFLICAGLTVSFLMWRRWMWFTPIVMGAGIAFMTLYWINETQVTAVFRWVKLYTLVVSVWFFWFVRYTPLHKYVLMRFLVAAILAVNIAEAVKVDFTSGYLPNVLNGLAGIFSILAMTRWNAIGPNRTPSRDLIWPGQAVAWIIAYDIWNVAFSYLNFNEYTSNSIALNLTPTIIALLIPGVWVAARGTTLGFFYLYLFTFTFLVMEQSFVPLPINTTLALVVAVVSFVANLAVCLLVWNWKLFQKGPAWPSFGQYRHAEHITGVDDSIHVDLDKIPAMADYPPKLGLVEDAPGSEPKPAAL